MTELQNLQQNRPSGTPSLLSQLDTDFLYKGGQNVQDRQASATFPGTTFFNPRGEQIRDINFPTEPIFGLTPFRHINLWSRRYSSASMLEQTGILDRSGGILRLRGTVAFDEPLLLSSKTGTLTVMGQGVLIAPGIRVTSTISRGSPDAFCILYARRGPIELDAAGEIQASLLALNDTMTGAVRPLKPFRLAGSMITDRLDLPRFPPGQSVVLYDPRLSSGQELFSITFSRWIPFQRLTMESTEP